MSLIKNGRQNLDLYDTRALVHHSTNLPPWMISKDYSKPVILSYSQLGMSVLACEPKWYPKL